MTIFKRANKDKEANIIEVWLEDSTLEDGVAILYGKDRKDETQAIFILRNGEIKICPSINLIGLETQDGYVKISKI